MTPPFLLKKLIKGNKERLRCKKARQICSHPSSEKGREKIAFQKRKTGNLGTASLPGSEESSLGALERRNNQLKKGGKRFALAQNVIGRKGGTKQRYA